MGPNDGNPTARRGEGDTRTLHGPRADANSAPSRGAPSRAGRAGSRPVRTPSGENDPHEIYLRLTREQVGELMGTVRERRTPGMSDVLAGWLAREEIPPLPFWESRYRESVRGGEFSLSTLKGLLVFSCLLDGWPVGVKDVADRLQMHQSAAHRYLATFLILGLVEQHPKTRKYQLVR